VEVVEKNLLSNAPARQFAIANFTTQGRLMQTKKAGGFPKTEERLIPFHNGHVEQFANFRKFPFQGFGRAVQCVADRRANFPLQRAHFALFLFTPRPRRLVRGRVPFRPKLAPSR